jgi:hypothetical protein
MNSWYFVIDGDPQVGNVNGKPQIREECANMGERLNEYCKKNLIDIDFVLCTGDLTGLGTDGLQILCWKNGEHNQLKVFLDDYYYNLQNNGYKVYCCPGNHDTYVNWPYYWKPVFHWLKKTYGATYNPFITHYNSGYYKFEHKGILIMSLGIYPYNLNWIRNNLPKDKKKPIILFWHYNTIDAEPFSNWWSKEEKDKFYEIIKDYNILLIANGHWHGSGWGEWNGIKIIRGSGYNKALIKITGEETELSWIR